jgi:predicted dehydrogenase
MSRSADTQSTTRRGFLKQSAAVAAGAATLSVVQGAHAAGSGPIRLGLIGCGSRGPGTAAEYLKVSKDVQLVAMNDVFADHLQGARKWLTEKYPEQMKVDDEHCFVGLEGYKHVIESCDLVAIACATKFHPMYAEAGIMAGKHVFCEKPHAIDPLGIQRNRAVCELAKQKGLSYLSGLYSRHDVGWKECVQRIHDGAIGDIVTIQCRFLRAPYVVRPRQGDWTEMQYQFRNWYHFFWLSGDDVPQSLVHNMDRAEWILKEELPRSCYGLAGRSSSFGDQYGDMYDHHTVAYEYPSGARVYAMCRTQENCFDAYDDVIIGTKGVCDLEKCRITGENKWQFKGTRRNPYELEQLYMVNSILEGKPCNSGYHCNNSTMITLMGQISCYTGQAMNYKDIDQSKATWGPEPEKVDFGMDAPTKPDVTGNYPLPKPGFTKMV